MENSLNLKISTCKPDRDIYKKLDSKYKKSRTRLIYYLSSKV